MVIVPHWADTCFSLRLFNITLLTYSKHVKIKSAVAFFLWLEDYTLYVTLYFHDHGSWTNPCGHRLHAMDGIQVLPSTRGQKTAMCNAWNSRGRSLFFMATNVLKARLRVR